MTCTAPSARESLIMPRSESIQPSRRREANQLNSSLRPEVVPLGDATDPKAATGFGGRARLTRSCQHMRQANQPQGDAPQIPRDNGEGCTSTTKSRASISASSPCSRNAGQYVRSW